MATRQRERQAPLAALCIAGPGSLWRCPINMGNEYQALEGLRLKAMKGTTNTNKQEFCNRVWGSSCHCEVSTFRQNLPQNDVKCNSSTRDLANTFLPYDIFNTKDHGQKSPTHCNHAKLRNASKSLQVDK